MNVDRLWKTILEDLEINISRVNYNAWIKPCFIKQINEIAKDRLLINLACPSAIHREMIDRRFWGQIKEAMDRVTGKKCELVLIIEKRQSKKTTNNSGPLFARRENELLKEKLKSTGLREDFVFDSFAVSTTNQMAYAAATAVAKNPGKAYNPLFLYGGVGVGKTHLMQAIGHEILKNNSKMRLIYCMGEDFTNGIIEAIKGKTTKQFRNRFRTTNVLLIDDIQFIAGKTAVQEEFFHTFNALQRNGGQIILTSDRSPYEIGGLEDRLRSRFEGGLTIDIQKPNFELRCAIVKIKAEIRKINLDMEVVSLIAANIESTRGLEGFLIRLLAESETKQMPISVELTKSLLGSQLQTDEKKTKIIKPKEILEEISKFYDVKVSSIKGNRRLKRIVNSRHVAMYLLRTELRMTLIEIADLLGKKDHTTVMHGLDKITRILPQSDSLRAEIGEIKNRLYK